MLIFLAAVVLVLVAGAIITFGYYYYVRPGQLLDQLVSPSTWAPQVRRSERGSVMARWLEPIGNLLPVSAQDTSVQEQELIAAGIRNKNAVRIVYGAKLVLAALLLTVALAVRGRMDNPILRLVLPVAGCGIGFLLPGFVVGRLITRRNNQVRMALPDVLDLLVICTEAGCGLDQAMINVSRELKNVHPAVSEELALVTMEIMAGKGRSEALRNFARRSGEDELKKIVAILVQTDRFGTSVADALRTQSDYLRIRRRQEAEERAGKVGVKLVFPIFFFCLPSLLVVTAGPGILQLLRNMDSMSGGQ
ncbi:MAG TPA: type II secretion system F family protein [Bryobacteraceae bacterium]|nr:type II secretion system F family protein [Bryobacteraceae bacterium]